MIECPECGSNMIQRTGRFGIFYGCVGYPLCTVTMKANQDTGEPIGLPADKETKALRIKAHEAFDPIWQNGKIERNEAYEWLAAMLDISKADCHIGDFDKEMCQRVIEACGE